MARHSFMAATLALALLPGLAPSAHATTYYSSPTATDPTSLASWWTYPDGTGSTPPDFTSGDVFVVQPGHSMATTNGWAISGTGSALWLQSGATLTVGDGDTKRLELTGAEFRLDAGATYVHDSAAEWDRTCFKPGVTTYFDVASTVVLRATPLHPGTDIAWGNLTIDLATSPGADWSWQGDLTRVYGDLTVTNTGGHAMWLTSDGDVALAIHGGLLVNGGDLELGSGSDAVTVNLAGDLTLTAGALGSSSAGIHTVAFGGGEAPRVLTWTGGTLGTAHLDWRVDDGTLTLASDLDLSAARSLTVAPAGTLALAAALTNAGELTVDGVLRIEDGGSVSDEAAYGGSARLVYAGGSVTTGPEWAASGSGAPEDVTVAVGAGESVTLRADRAVTDTLAFVSGTLVTGADTLTLGPACVVTGAGAVGYVRGNLARVVPAGLTGPLAFDVGDAAGYAPVVVAFDSVVVSGTLTASTAAPGAPPAGEPPTGSGIHQSAYVDRCWTLVNAVGGSVGFGSCAATFHWLAADVQGDGDPDDFIVARDSAGAWSHPAVTDALTGSITATGLAGFGEFRVGEPAGGPSVAVDPLPFTESLLAPAAAPNPSRGGARVFFSLPAASTVRLRVLDLQGRTVATLVDGMLPAGRFDVLWDGSTMGGTAWAGLYFAHLEACGRSVVGRIALVR